MTVHGDLIDHDTDSDDCPCGPDTIPVQRDDGSIGWQVVHHSLDGREHRERGSQVAEHGDEAHP